jgi:hypothetical protein
MKLDWEGITFGAELEFADIDTRGPLPYDDVEWDFRDYSICNSNGVANDPKKKLNRYGSEIHIGPKRTPMRLVDLAMDVIKLHPEANVNWSTNLHVHIRLPGLRDDLKSLKRLAMYIRAFAPSMYERIDPIPEPPKVCYRSVDVPEFDGMWRRYKRRKRSHHYQVSDAVYQKLIDAKSPQDFLNAHAPFSAKTGLQWHLVQRAGVNLAHLLKTDTIEFRCFTMSIEWRKLYSAFRWPWLFLRAALISRKNVHQILASHPNLVFQKFHPYDYKQDAIFQQTRLEHRTRSEVAATLEKLIREKAIRRADIGGEGYPSVR